MNNIVLLKTCSKCNTPKKLEDFSKDKSKKDGKHSSCKECKRNCDANYRKNNGDKKRQLDRDYYQKNSEKIKERSKEWYDNNKEHCSSIKKKWYEKNFDKVKEYREDYKNKDPQKWTDYMRTYQRNRYQTDLQYRIKTILNKRIRDYANKKYQTTLDITGCSMEFFISWIESQFDENMSWGNQGSYWDFDHVVPCASFDLTNEEQKFKCYNWSNIRPCEKRENIVKKDKIIKSLIIKQKELAEQFKLNFV